MVSIGDEKFIMDDQTAPLNEGINSVTASLKSSKGGVLFDNIFLAVS